MRLFGIFLCGVAIPERLEHDDSSKNGAIRKLEHEDSSKNGAIGKS